MAKLWLQRPIFTIGKYDTMGPRATFKHLCGGTYDEENWCWPWNRSWTASDRGRRNGSDPASAVWGTAGCSKVWRPSGLWRARSRARLRTANDAAAAVERR
jgi:hypothetical protein